MEAVRNSKRGTEGATFSPPIEPHAWKEIPQDSAAGIIRATVDNTLKYASLPSFYGPTSGIVKRVIINTPDLHDETVGEIAKRVLTSKHSLLLQTYIFHAESDAARELCEAVALRQRTCPAFRCVIAYNALSSSSKEKLHRLTERCGAAISLVPYDQGWSRRSLHSKVAILDGQTAFIGGSNIDNPTETDIALEVSGSVVKKMVAEFLSLLREIRCNARVRGASELLSSPGGLGRKFLQSIPEAAPAPETPMVLLATSGNSWHKTEVCQVASAALLNAIDAAQEEICIRSPNVNDIYLLAALARAAERRIAVKILLPKGYLAVPSFIDCAGNYAPLIYKAQRVEKEHAHNFSVRWYSDDGVNPSPSHAKLFMIDGIPIVGSQNADNQSFWFSRELNVAICSRSEGEKIRASLFDEAWDKGIETRTHFLHHILPIPESSWQKRISRLIFLPGLIFHNWRQFLGRSAAYAAQ